MTNSLAIFIAAALLSMAGEGPAMGQASDRPTSSHRVAQTVELAPLMGELQRLTHKLSLSVAEANYELAAFYLYESLQSINEIKKQVPEYRGFPVALLIDQINLPQYLELEQSLRKKPEVVDDAAVVSALSQLIDGCNECHKTTGHGFIKVTSGGGINPFNQDFSVEP